MRYEEFKQTLNTAAEMVKKDDTLEDIWEYFESRGINASVEMVISFVTRIHLDDRYNHWH